MGDCPDDYGAPMPYHSREAHGVETRRRKVNDGWTDGWGSGIPLFLGAKIGGFYPTVWRFSNCLTVFQLCGGFPLRFVVSG